MVEGAPGSSAPRLVTVDLEGRDGMRRTVTVHLPIGTPEAVLYAGDGQVLAPWGVDLDRPELPATLMVGVHRVDDEEERLAEYSPGFDPARFARHERFLLDVVQPWVSEHFGVDPPRERTATFGVSAGAELALALAMRRPDVFGAALCASPGGGYRPPVPLPVPRPRVSLVAGLDEPWFAENARRWADALAAAGDDVVFVERPGAHGDPFWRAELPSMVRWAFTDTAPNDT